MRDIDVNQLIFSIEMDTSPEITAGRRLPSITKEEWNRQTTVDARNVLHTYQSVDQSPSSADNRTEKSNNKISSLLIIDFFQLLNHFHIPNMFFIPR